MTLRIPPDKKDTVVYHSIGDDLYGHWVFVSSLMGYKSSVLGTARCHRKHRRDPKFTVGFWSSHRGQAWLQGHERMFVLMCGTHQMYSLHMKWTETFINVIILVKWTLMLNENWQQNHRIVTGFTDVRRKTQAWQKESTEYVLNFMLLYNAPAKPWPLWVQIYLDCSYW